MSVAARVAVFQLLVMGGLGDGVLPPELDYSVLSRHTFTARRRTSDLVATNRATALTSRARLTQSIAAERPTTNTARTRATEG